MQIEKSDLSQTVLCIRNASHTCACAYCFILLMMIWFYVQEVPFLHTEENVQYIFLNRTCMLFSDLSASDILF
jgi:hypothetical protein